MKLSWALRLGLYAFIPLLISPYHDSWSPTMGLLVRMGVYEHCCTPEQIAEGSFDRIKCNEQGVKISTLLSVFRIPEFVTSMGIGVFMDMAGTKSCIVLGIGLRIVSWILLSIFPQTSWCTILGCVLAGLSWNAIVFPVYTIGRYWPAYQDMAMCIVSASLSFGCFHPLIVNYMLDAMYPVNTGVFMAIQMVLTHFPTVILSFIIFPNDLVKDINDNMTASMVAKNREFNIQDAVIDSDTWKLKVFVSYIINYEVLVITAFFILNCVSLTFAQETFTQVYINNKVAEDFNSIMLPLSSLFSFLFMLVISRFGTAVVLFGLNIVSATMHLTLLSSTTLASIFVSIGISMTFSGFVTFFFIYLEKIVEIKYSGSIMGYLTTVAGISLAVNPILNALIGSYDVMNACQITFVVLRALALAPLFWLIKRERLRMFLKKQTSSVIPA